MPSVETEEQAETATVNPIWKNLQTASFITLAVLLVICLGLAWFTQDAMSHQANLPVKASTAGALVEPWQTAVDLSSMAVTAEEQRYAREAESFADHEVHQAFQAALNQAQLDVQKRRNQPDAIRLQKVVDQHQQTVNQDQANLKNLQAQKTDEATADVDLVNAQLDLDTDELKDAQQALTHDLQDQRGDLEQQLTAHEAAVKKHDSDAAAKSLGAVATAHNYGTLLRRLKAWFDQRTRYDAIQQAANQAEAAAKLVALRQNQMSKPSSKAVSDTAADSHTRMNAMKRASIYKQMQMISSDQMEYQNRLADTYKRWAAQVQIQHRIVFHLLMQSMAYLFVILLGGLIVNASIGHFFGPAGSITARLGRSQYSTRVLLNLVVDLIAAVLIFLLIFGPPGQLSTVLGLLTAGLTVVLQDFIISFCGWFVLIGKRGIRVGDWVEIDGISGEVSDLGVFRTALLETGNWNDRGQPTGRHITFANSFAIKGQYFNFTTNGQWMWDEMTVTVPASEAYGTIELIYKALLEETKSDAEIAEVEWKRSGLTPAIGDVNTQASVNMRPSGTNIDIVMRYVTRASSRYTVRNVIYQRVLDVTHKPVA